MHYFIAFIAFASLILSHAQDAAAAYRYELQCAVKIYSPRSTVGFRLPTPLSVTGIAVGTKKVTIRNQTFEIAATVYVHTDGGVQALELVVSQLDPRQGVVWRSKTNKEAPYHDLVGWLGVSRFIRANTLTPSEDFLCEPLFD